jgi:Ser/Thr protein kinase RdoA (MazF antagonist)
MPAALQALSAFGVEPREVRLVWHAENLTFRVIDARGGEAYALRLHRPGYNSLEELQAEFAWARALAASGVPTPVRLVAEDGAGYVATYTAERDEHRFASLTQWVEGILLSRVLEAEPDLSAKLRYMAELGALVARMHKQSVDWVRPAGFERRRLDMEALIGERPVWGRFERLPGLSIDERVLLLRARDRLRGRLDRQALDGLGFGLIHADPHPGNVIVVAGALSVIDFDDAGFGYHLYDLAAILIQFQDEADFPAYRTALLQGYRSVRSLPEAMLDLLPAFLVIRGLGLLGWFEQRPKLAGSDAFTSLKDSVVSACGRLNSASF